MATINHRVVLVIGKSFEENQRTVKKYSLDTPVEPYLKMRRKDAAKTRKKHLNLIKETINSKVLAPTDYIRGYYKDKYTEIQGMTDEEYFQCVTMDNCTYDQNGDAWTTENPDAKYKYERCMQERLAEKGVESDFANPFILKNGSKSYTAKARDIDWDKLHMHGTELYRAAWELVVFEREPQNEQEERIKARMGNRRSYFDNFADVDEYVRHSCSYWTYGVATDKEYVEVDYRISDKDWVAQYFDRFIKPLKGDEELTLFEVVAID